MRDKHTPMNTHHYIACDLGAESGRVILGTFREGLLTLKEIHRFSNDPIRVEKSLCWDAPRIFAELKIGLSCVAQHLKDVGDKAAESLSVDSWGVDYVLMDSQDAPLALPFHYRDPRTTAPYAEATEKASETIFAETGIQFMPINTLYQLLAHRQQEPEQINQAKHLLLMADYFQFLLSGIGVAERSLASTTQCYNPQTMRWAQGLLEHFDLPESLFPPLVESGTILGPVLPEIASETGLGSVLVLATCSHDTAAAVAAVPAEKGPDGKNDWAYLSSGTWSLLGVELPEPLINDRVRDANFTNEAGYGGGIRFLKNIAGLWIVQECRRDWRTDGTSYSYEELTEMATEATPFRSLIRPDDVRFLGAGEMTLKICAYCRETGQSVPETPGQFIRCILESLALSYRQTIEQIENLTGRKLRRLHIVGGGSRNNLLNQFAADATGHDVLVGPVEATAIGNLLLQALTLGHLNSLADLRRTVRASFPIRPFVPTDADAWNAPYTRFLNLEIMQS
jgi:rhamnulokinase